MQLEGRKRANREAEAAAGVAAGAVPQGSAPWERVISVCNFNGEALSKDPFKELSRHVDAGCWQSMQTACATAAAAGMRSQRFV